MTVASTVVVLILSAQLLACGGPADDATEAGEAASPDHLEPVMVAFLEEHPELGELRSMEPEANWRRGERRQVELSTGRYLVYFLDGRVVTVQEHLEGGGWEDVYREEVPPMPQPVAEGPREASAELPPYEILDSVQTIDGRVYGDVLVSSFSQETPVEVRRSAAMEIARRENIDLLTLYCSREAQRANFSASFAEQHPDALETCSLGTWEDGVFRP